MPSPFFSVCLETYNRGKTIFNALESVQNQTFRDFEVIIVDDRSTDNTVEEIRRFFQSKLYNGRPFEYTFKQNKEHLGGVKNWNEPLELASGKYIAVLEGDDQYLPSHLEEAHRILTNYNKIGIYAVGNQHIMRPITGLINPEAYFKYTYRMNNVSPPSETIFIRRYDNKQYFYNPVHYLYAPEVALYLEISSDGWNIYHSEKQTIVRSESPKKIYYSGEPLHDRIKVINQYKNHRYISKGEYFEVVKSNTNRALMSYVSVRMRNVGRPNDIYRGFKDLLRDVSRFKYYELCALKIISDILIKCKLNNILIRAYHLCKGLK